jgi:kinesin family protein 11
MLTFKQLHTSYSSIGKDFKSIFEDLVRHITAQRTESDSLRRQLQTASNTILLQNNSISTRMQEALEEERRQAADDRQKLLTQITSLVNAQADVQEARFADRTAQIQKSIQESCTSLEGAVATHGEGMASWDEKQGQLLEDVKKSRDLLKTRLKDDWNVANEQSTSIQNTAKSVHAETTRVVDEQTEDLDSQMKALDDFVTRARSENSSHHESHGQCVQALSNAVEQSFGNISAHFKTTFDRVQNLGDEMESDANDLQDGLEPLDAQLCQPLANLREGISATALHEYQPTGETPQKMQYQYPTKLPRTQTRETVLSNMAEEPSLVEEDKESIEKDDTLIFADLGRIKQEDSPLRSSSANLLDKNALSMSLREVNPNVTTGAINFDPRASIMSMPAEHTMPLFKRSSRVTRSGLKKQSMGMLVEGRENLPLTALEEDMSRRKSPRLN